MRTIKKLIFTTMVTTTLTLTSSLYSMQRVAIEKTTQEKDMQERTQELLNAKTTKLAERYLEMWMQLYSINQKNNSGDTLLMNAVKAGNEKLVIILLQQLANPNIANSCGLTPLIQATMQDNAEMVTVLINYSETLQLNKTNPTGDTAVIIASKNNNTKLAQALIAAGADTKKRNNYGDTALKLAVANNDLTLFETIISVEPNPEQKHMLLRTTVEKNSTEIALLLLKAGAQASQVNEHGNSLVMQAIAFGNTEIVNMLIEHGADVDMINSEGQTALLFATTCRPNIDILRMLLHTSVATIDKADQKGTTPLLHALCNHDMNTAMLLINHGANVNVKDELGNCPLKAAMNIAFTFNGSILLYNGTIKIDHIQLVKLLILAGVDYTAINSDKTTKRQCTSMLENHKTVQTALEIIEQLEQQDFDLEDRLTWSHLPAGFTRIGSHTIDLIAQYGYLNSIKHSSEMHEMAITAINIRKAVQKAATAQALLAPQQNALLQHAEGDFSSPTIPSCMRRSTNSHNGNDAPSTALFLGEKPSTHDAALKEKKQMQKMAKVLSTPQAASTAENIFPPVNRSAAQAVVTKSSFTSSPFVAAWKYDIGTLNAANEIMCYQCTFFNKQGAYRCQMCEALLF